VVETADDVEGTGGGVTAIGVVTSAVGHDEPE